MYISLFLQLSKSDHEAAHEREQEFLEKIAELTARVADLTSTNTGIYGAVACIKVSVLSFVICTCCCNIFNDDLCLSSVGW